MTLGTQRAARKTAPCVAASPPAPSPFLFTDVEGSTKLLEELGDEAYDEALTEHRRLIREACAAHGGVEVDTQGDAFFFAFPMAPGALAAASEMTCALAAGPIRVRVGLHTGEPRLSGEGYVGKEVHFAARVAATGHGGQIAIADACMAIAMGDGARFRASIRKVLRTFEERPRFLEDIPNDRHRACLAGG